MPLTFNPIDYTNYPFSPTFDGQHWVLARVLNDLWCFAYASAFNMPPGAFSNQPLLYKSSDSGVTWSLIDATCPVTIDNACIESFSYSPVSGRLRLAYVPNANGGHHAIEFTEFDPATPGGGWTAVENIGGGLNVYSYAPGVPRFPCIVDYLRADGSRIIVRQTVISDNAIQIIKKSAGGSWSSLAIIQETSPSPGQDCTFMSAGQRSDDTIDVFYMRVTLGVSGHGDICHVTVSSADAISSEHVIESMTTCAQASGRVDYSANGNTVAYAYAKDAISNYPNGELHVAVGDLTGDPLNPAWTAENTGFIATAATFNDVELGISFEGGNTVNVYWQTKYGSGADLKKSTRTAPGTWAAATTLYSANLNGFDLLNAFPNGVGILIEEFDSGIFQAKIQYVGPPITTGGSYIRQLARKGKQHSFMLG